MNEKAISPVIGVILMVAITVILAAVIAAFVFNMADTVRTNPLRQEAAEWQQNQPATNCACIQQNLSFCEAKMNYREDVNRCLKIVCPECYVVQDTMPKTQEPPI